MQIVASRKSVGFSVVAAMLGIPAFSGIMAVAKNKVPSVAKKSSTKKIKPKIARNTVFIGYRSWNCVNPEALWIPDRTVALCAAPSTIQAAPSPHDGKFIRVYVNGVARDAMLKRKSPQFARGSMIVKEKLATEKSDAAELLTVMVKREVGFNAPNGDWEYLVLNGSGTRIQQRGKLGNCQSCHAPQKETDYVFRTYLPAEVERALR